MHTKRPRVRSNKDKLTRENYLICSCMVARQSAEKNEEITYSAVNPLDFVDQGLETDWSKAISSPITNQKASIASSLKRRSKVHKNENRRLSGFERPTFAV